MKTTRLGFVGLAIPAVSAIPLLSVGAAGKDSGANEEKTVSAADGIEGQRQADLGNGQYLNPVLAGDHHDPNVLKDGDDYYMSYSSFDYGVEFQNHREAKDATLEWLLWYNGSPRNWPALSALTQLASVCSTMPRAFAAAPTFCPEANRRTASCLYSNVSDDVSPFPSPSPLRDCNSSLTETFSGAQIGANTVRFEDIYAELRVAALPSWHSPLNERRSSIGPELR